MSEITEANFSLDQDQFRCPVCLDLLKDPVTIPCGHSYCMRCITDYWNQEDSGRICRCPLCKQTFTPRPVLGKNVVFAEMVEKLKKMRLQAAAPAVHHTGSGDVLCDCCTGIEQKAVKSCLECRSSYCQNHLKQHENLFRGKGHNLMDATGRLQEMICPEHDKILEIYCHTDQQCICMLCLVDEHKNHDTESTAAARREKQRYLEETQKQIQEIIQQREKDLQKLKKVVESHKRSAQTALEDSERIFTELIRSIEKSRSEVKQLIRDKERAAVSQAEEQLVQLKKEIDDLKRRNTEMKQLLHTDDHVNFLQSLLLVSQYLFGSTDTFTGSCHLSFDDVVKSISQLRDKMQHFCRAEIEKLTGKVKTVKVNGAPECQTRKEFLQYFHLLTLDLNSVHNQLLLSEENTVITVTDTRQRYPKHPDRFDYWMEVLCRERVTRRCYWEVEWSGDELYLSVAYKSIMRKGKSNESRFGSNDQSWRLFCCNSSCSFWHNNIETVLPVTHVSSKIGVYVDHSAGILSFYSITDTMSLIHRVQTTFFQPLYAGFGLGHNSTAKLCRLQRFYK